MKISFERIEGGPDIAVFRGMADTGLRIEKRGQGWEVCDDRADSFLFAARSLEAAKGILTRIMEAAQA